MLRDNTLVELRKKFKKAKKERDELKLTLEKFQTSLKNLSKLIESQITDKTGLGYDNQVFNSTVFDYDELNSSDSDVSVPTSPVHDRTSVKPAEHPTQAENLRKDILKSRGLESIEARLVVYQHNENVFENDIKLLKLDVMLRDNTLVELRKKFKKAKKERDELKLTLEKFQTSLKNLSKLIESQITDKTGLGYDNQVFNSTVFDYDELNSSDSDVSVPTSPVHDRTSVKPAEHPTQAENLRKDILKSRDCDYYEKKMVQNPMKNHAIKTLSLLFDVHGNPQQALKDKGVIDSGCSRHMTENISYLSDFKEINRGYVAFGGNPKSGKMTGKGKIKTGKLDFDDVYFVKEFKFNLFSVLQICDKKNSVLFTDTECVVLSSNFKMPDENHVLLRVPRENNMYNVDLKNIVPSGDLTWNRPTWLFDIDTLTQSMNYQPVVAGNQPNHNADSQNTDANAAFDDKESKSEVHVSPSSSDKPKKHDEKAKQKAKGNSHVDLSIRVRDLRDEFEEFFVNNNNEVNAASTLVTVVGPNSTNSANSFNAARPSDNAVSLNFKIGGKSLFLDPSQYPDDPDMPALEDIIYSDDEEDVGFEDSDYPNKVYKVVKALYGLHQAPRACQDKYVADILWKFGLTYGKSASTPIDTEKPLLKDPDGEDVDVHIYRLISWQCKKQTVIAISLTEAEYVAAARCCAQVLWIQNQLLDYGLIITAVSYMLILFGLTKDVVHLMLLGFDHILDFLTAYTVHYTLMVNLTIYVSCIKQFWASVSIKKSNDAVKLQALIDRKKEIFAELARMGYEKPSTKLTFYKAFWLGSMEVPHSHDCSVYECKEDCLE
nr:ribonuclease H-like domain-containing protein [Tanacetum cinerariifolium]